MLSPAAFPVCADETGTRLQRVCPGHCRSFQNSPYPSELLHRAERDLCGVGVSLLRAGLRTYVSLSVLLPLLPPLVISESPMATPWAL